MAQNWDVLVFHAHSIICLSICLRYSYWTWLMALSAACNTSTGSSERTAHSANVIGVVLFSLIGIFVCTELLSRSYVSPNMKPQKYHPMWASSSSLSLPMNSSSEPIGLNRRPYKWQKCTIRNIFSCQKVSRKDENANINRSCVIKNCKCNSRYWQCVWCLQYHPVFLQYILDERHQSSPRLIFSGCPWYKATVIRRKTA